MPARTRLTVLLAIALLPVAAQADKLDKDAKKFLDEVRPLILPDEEKALKEIKSSDRVEFEKIFWARRNPNLDAPENEFKTSYDKTRADIDVRFKVGGRPGSQSDCGRVFVLLGEPAEIKKDGANQTWTYKGAQFKDGQTQITFEVGCTLPQGSRLGESLNRVAENKIAQPNLSYKKNADGSLVKLADQLPKPTPAQALIKTPRQDFPGEAQATMFLRSPTPGGVYVAGVIRAEAKNLTLTESGGKKSAKVMVVMQVVDDAGRVTSAPEREMTAPVGADDAILASYGIVLKPGKFTLKVGLLDAKSGKGSVVTTPLEMPDFGGEELSIAPLLFLQEVQENITPDVQDPLASFVLGKFRFVPRFNNAFTKKDQLTVLASVYHAKKDEATGKASTTTTFKFSKDGRSQESEPQNAEAEDSAPSLGPIPLDKFTPGTWTVEVKVVDHVAKKDFTRKGTFEIKE